jgi:hypothetical protein
MGSWFDPSHGWEGGMSHWADTAYEVHQGLPAAATLEERTKAVDDAYPFGERAYSPYKTWLKARREYLCRYGYQPKASLWLRAPWNG